MSLFWFEQLPNILKKKLYVKKVNSLFSYGNNVRKKFFIRKLDQKFVLI